MSKITLYKFRSFDNMDFFLDIVENNRLFAAKYSDLNDPMEGHYFSDGLPKDKIAVIKGEKKLQHICSLSMCCRDVGLWTFYADEGRGCCIEIELDIDENFKTTDDWLVKNVIYADNLGKINNTDFDAGNYVEKILYRKFSRWLGEKECRCTHNSSEYIPVKIKRILMGYNVSPFKYDLIKTYIDRINKTREPEDPIEIIQFDRKDLSHNLVCACHKVNINSSEYYSCEHIGARDITYI